jgi:hypothetical protein
VPLVTGRIPLARRANATRGVLRLSSTHGVTVSPTNSTGRNGVPASGSGATGSAAAAIFTFTSERTGGRVAVHHFHDPDSLAVFLVAFLRVGDAGPRLVEIVHRFHAEHKSAVRENVFEPHGNP